jgi:hypothetical protein
MDEVGLQALAYRRLTNLVSTARSEAKPRCFATNTSALPSRYGTRVATGDKPPKVFRNRAPAPALAPLSRLGTSHGLVGEHGQTSLGRWRDLTSTYSESDPPENTADMRRFEYSHD